MTDKNLIYLHQLRTLSDNCRTIRIRKGFSTLDLSVKSEVSERTIYNIECSSGNVTIQTLINLAFALDVKLNDLLIK